VQNANIHVCSGGILGLGEGQTDRASMLRSLANLEKHHPASFKVNACAGVNIPKVTQVSIPIAFTP
jgi:biotin synthase-like enzyme